MSRTQRLVTVLLLNVGLVAGLVAVGITAHSLGVLAEGGDYLMDAAGIGVALVALRLSSRAGESRYKSATTFAALFNAGWLLVLELLVAVAAITRLATRVPRVDGLPVLIASAVAAVVMALGAVILRGDDPDDDSGDRDLSVAAVLLDTLADAIAAAGVAAAGAIILVVDGWYWLDPAVALVIAVFFVWHAGVLCLKALRKLRAPPEDDDPR